MSIYAGEQVTVAATALPVSVQELKDHSRIEYPDDDNLIEDLLRAAVEHVEAVTGRALVTQTRRATFDRFPAVYLELPAAPCASVVSVYYDDIDFNETLFPSTLYRVRATGLDWRRANIEPYTDWPASLADADAIIRVSYVCGYGAPSDVPYQLRQAVKMLAAHWYEHREDSLPGVTAQHVDHGVRALCAMYRLRGVDQ